MIIRTMLIGSALLLSVVQAWAFAPGASVGPARGRLGGQQPGPRPAGPCRLEFAGLCATGDSDDPGHDRHQRRHFAGNRRLVRTPAGGRATDGEATSLRTVLAPPGSARRARGAGDVPALRRCAFTHSLGAPCPPARPDLRSSPPDSTQTRRRDLQVERRVVVRAANLWRPFSADACNGGTASVTWFAGLLNGRLVRT